MIGGLERVQSGSLLVGGLDVAVLRGDALAAYRRMTVGFIFQNFGLLEALTALENVKMGRSGRGTTSDSPGPRTGTTGIRGHDPPIGPEGSHRTVCAMTR